MTVSMITLTNQLFSHLKAACLSKIRAASIPTTAKSGQLFCAGISVVAVLLSPVTYASEAAGIVTMTIGKAYLNGDTLITSGTELQAGDNIETLSNGHVHIRFIDNGLVSVRPNSQLYIEHYRYNPDSPDQSIIKFDLESGVMRSISGKGAKAARDKFRLNTPIAAIGVRGTDFVVKASSDLIQAVVNEGAIVVAPFSSACEADTFGPCSENSVELSGDTKQLLELSALTASPRLVPLSETFAKEMGVSHSTQKQATERTSNSETKAATEEESHSAANTDAQSSDSEDLLDQKSSHSDDSPLSSKALKESLNGKGISFSTLLELANKNEFTDEDRKKLEAFSLDREDLGAIVEVINADGLLPNETVSKPDNYVPEMPLSQETQDARKITWGRFNSAPLTSDRITTSTLIARGGIAGDRDSYFFSMGDKQYLLFRDKSERNEINPNLGKLNLQLVNAEATLTTLDGQRDVMAVTDGWMSLDFNSASFSTGITANHELTQDIQVRSSGHIRKNGLFETTAGDSLVGATTLDGKAASTRFAKDVEAGVVEGAAYFSK